MNSIYIAASAREELKDYIVNMGFNLVEVPVSNIASAIASHADIQLCRLNGTIIVRAREDELGPKYPEDAVFNACSTGKYFIHRLDITHPRLLSCARNAGLQLIDVKQGYARCSCIPIDENSVITYDRGISGKCESCGIEVLLVSPGNVLLPGYTTGFIGGAAGRVGNTIVFNGDLSAHPDYDSIVSFIEARGLQVKYFREWPLTDIGSII